MKKIVIIILAIFASYSIQAKKIFVEMEFHKNCIKLDDGTNKKPQILKDKTGKELKFTSLIGALNFMSLQGWDLEDTKSIISGAGYVGTYGGASATNTKVYYIFSKDVSDNELRRAVEESYKE